MLSLKCESCTLMSSSKVSQLVFAKKVVHTYHNSIQYKTKQALIDSLYQRYGVWNYKIKQLLYENNKI